MGKDKKKKVDGMTKTLEKTAKKELKNLKKEFGEDDIDQLLSEIKKKDESTGPTNVSSTPCEPPTPRSGASWLAHPTKGELILFGGELYNGKTTSVYNDLLIYNIARKEWKKVTSSVCPPPRSAHQAVVIDKPEAPEMWIFGGEFTSPSGNQFHHYRDLWKLDLSTYTWELKAGGEKLGKSKGSASASSGVPSGPSARSGHRMIAYKHKLVVFGGFFDSGYETKYFSDMHQFDMDAMAWLPATQFTSALAPGPRSGFGFFVNELTDTAYVYGGFAMETKKKEVRPGAKKSKSAGQSVQVPVTYGDFWSLNLVNSSWTQVKKRGYFPAAGRFAMAVGTQKEKGRVFVFGGVKDEEAASAKKKRDDDDDDEDTVSTSFNDLYCFDMQAAQTTIYNDLLIYNIARKDWKKKDQQRWFFVDYKGDRSEKSASYEVSLKVKAKAGADKTAAAKEGDKNEDDEDQEAAGESSIFDFNPVRDALPAASSSSSSSSAAAASESLSLTPSVSVPVPAPRRSSLLCFKGSHCYLYGGVMEQKNSDSEHTFGDVWALDVNKPAGGQAWELLGRPVEEAEWQGSEDEAEDEDEDEEEEKGNGKKRRDSEDDDDDEDDSSSDEEEEKTGSSSSAPSGPNLKPSVGESLTVYFSRTKAHWLAAAVPALEADRLAAIAAAEAAAKQAALEAKEAAEEQARLKAEAEASGEALPEEAAEVDASSLEDSAAAAAASEKERKAAKKDKKAQEKEDKKAEKKDKKADKKADKKGDKAAAGDDKDDAAAAALAAEEKAIRTKAFELAGARFQQR